MARSRSTPAPSTSQQPAHSIPAAVRPADAAPDDPFASLGGGTVKEKGKKSQQRAETPLPPHVREAFRRFVEAKVLAEYVMKRAENSEADVDRVMFELWQESLWKYKAQPQNPAIKLDKDGHPGKPDLEALFQVQDRFTKNNIHLPTIPNVDNEQPEQTAIRLRAATLELLVSMEVPQECAEEFLKNEVEMRPVKSLRSFQDLYFGHYEGKTWVEATPEEKAIALKMRDFVQRELSQEERDIVMVTTPQTEVKKGVIGRIPVYAKAMSHVKALFSVFSPVHFVGKAKMGLSDTPAEKVDRLKGVAADIIGNSDLG